MSGLAASRLRQERKNWRKDHPPHFWAKPSTNADGSLNILTWNAGIPGKAGTPWAGGLYKLRLTFSQDYPSKPPRVTFTPPLYHPNVYMSGDICLSIIDEGEDWKPSVTLRQILTGVQDLLDNPNLASPAQHVAAQDLRHNKALYLKKVKAVALKNKDPDQTS